MYAAIMTMYEATAGRNLLTSLAPDHSALAKPAHRQTTTKTSVETRDVPRSSVSGAITILAMRAVVLDAMAKFDVDGFCDR